MVDEEGIAVCCGQVTAEAELVGSYDVYTSERYRGRGHAQALCLQMLLFGRDRGAIVGYLQVEESNNAARHVYAGLGFSDAYGYHYRTPVANVAAATAPEVQG